MKNAIISTATIVEPTGVPAIMDINNPHDEHITDNTAEKTVTDLKVLKIRIAESAGKITRAEIKSEPTKFIARTIITAIITAIKRLYALEFVPLAFAKASSKVTANILL